MIRHFLDVEGMNTIQTPDFQRVARAIRKLVEVGGMGAIWGDAGVGKTYAVEYEVAQLPRRMALWIDFPPRPHNRHLANKILEQLTGRNPNLSMRQGTDELLMEVPARKRLLLIVDEAQQLEWENFEYLRYLTDHRGSQLAVLFVGGHGCWETLRQHPMLESRIHTRLRVRKLSDERVPEVIPILHPLLAASDPELIRRINGTWGRGYLRNWVSFLDEAQRLCRQLDRPLDDEIADNALDQFVENYGDGPGAEW